jgi:hypothetical protein
MLLFPRAISQQDEQEQQIDFTETTYIGGERSFSGKQPIYAVRKRPECGV